jgi:dihydrodipicolinate synthase/N-acetylneuraminate lyase
MQSTGVAGVDAAMGVTWCNTQGIIDRIRAALDAGIPNVHIGLPFFMPLAKPDVDRFFDDLAKAAPQARWIYYAHPSFMPILTGADYARLSQRFPEQFIGTKLAAASIIELTEILTRSPGLAHFVVDKTMAHGMLMGAKGCYSYWVNTMPRWHRAYMDACLARRWDDAIRYHLKLVGWEAQAFAKIAELRHRHAITGKARAALTGFLEDTGVTSPPYYPLAPELLLELQSSFNQFWSREIADEKFA